MCIRCKKRKGYMGIVNFRYKGISLAIQSEGSICKECNKELIKELLDRFLEKGLIKKKNGREVQVDWSYYKKFPIGDQHYKINRLLVAIKILSISSPGNYEIATYDNRIFNPQGSFSDNSSLFFTKIEHAIDYVQIVLHPYIENFDWEIRKISIAVNREDFVKSKPR